MVDAVELERVWVVPRLGEVAVPVAASRRGPCTLAVSVAAVLRPVVACGWPGFVLLHTHPHGGPPSAADHAYTRRLVAATSVVGVELLAHLVISPQGIYIVDGGWRPRRVMLVAS